MIDSIDNPKPDIDYGGLFLLIHDLWGYMHDFFLELYNTTVVCRRH